MARRRFRIAALAVVALVSLAAGHAGATADVPRDVPEDLRPWAAWVLHGHEAEACPQLPDGTAACEWPSSLKLDIGAHDGRFVQEWTLEAAGWARLPGGVATWPADVRVDGHPAAVVAQEGAPTTWLERGTHRLEGTFAWSSIPDSLAVPPDTGMLELRVLGVAVVAPSREAAGNLWLRRQEASAGSPGASAEADALRIAVHRLVTDGVPLLLQTRILVDVSGKAREALLGPVLPPGFIPLAIDSPLPARLEADGRLRVQLRPGNWTIVIDARHDGPVDVLAAPSVAQPWSDDEVWSLLAQPSLRLVSVSGVDALDPQQTAIPETWRSLPTFRVVPGQSMTLKQERRGSEHPPADDLALTREMWLDFDGRGVTSRDSMSGTLSRSWRLQSQPPWILGRAAADGQERMLTRLAPGQPPGLEVRASTLAMTADMRFEGSLLGVPAVGWEADVASLSATLHLPPGWRLLAAPGADEARGTWIGSWTLLDLFLLLIVSIAAARLWSWRVGALALATMALLVPEPGAPTWIWLAALSVEAVLRLLPPGRARRVVSVLRLGALAALVIIAVPFAVIQARAALHPVLGAMPTGAQTDFVSGGLASLSEEPSGALNGPGPRPILDAIVDKRRSDLHDEASSMPTLDSANAIAVQNGYVIDNNQYKVHDSKDVVATGPGLPDWKWYSVTLSWSGPVVRTQRLRLLLLGPLATGLLGFVRIGLMAALLLVLAAPRAFDWRGGLRGGRRVAPPAAAALGLLLAFRAAGAVPPDAMLDELRTRLLERPPCGTACAEITRMEVEASATTLRLRLEIAAAAESPVAVPGGGDAWSPTSALLDGRGGPAVRRDATGLWILVPAGVHQVLLEGPMPDRAAVPLALPTMPRRVTARLDGWTLGGLHADGSADSTLQLVREATRGGGHAATGGETLAPSALPAFAKVTRRITLDLRWEVTTTVERASTSGSAVVIAVPLLAGESVTSADARVEDGKVLVSLAAGEAATEWTSGLAEGPTIDLRAPATSGWTEVWRLAAGPRWHVEWSGLPPVLPEEGQGREPEWHPWPGEELHLAVTRPEGVPGAVLTVDSSVLTMTPGIRATDVVLGFTLRTSRGGDQVVTLPEGAELQSLSVDDHAQAQRQEGRSVRIGLTPGVHAVAMSWREPRGLSWHWRASEVDLGVPSVNARSRIVLGSNRWVLHVHGPPLGPAVLFWSELVVLALLAAGLARLRLTPLGFAAWLLLLVGLSQIPIWFAAIVVGWLLLLGLRARGGASLPPWIFDLAQVMLVVATCAALVVLFAAIRQGLLGEPQMQVVGNQSTASEMNWYQDRVDGALPRPTVVSAPRLVYRLAMLLWALWLASSLLRWLRWGWSAFVAGGAWKRRPPAVKPEKPARGAKAPFPASPPPEKPPAAG